jgi:integrase
MSGWTSVHERVQDYLQTRRSMGYELLIEGEQLLRFARFADHQGHCGALTLDLAVAWANLSKSASSVGPARRLEVIRPLAKYCAMFEPETEIPPPKLLGPGHRRIAPYIYTEQEISALLGAARNLLPKGGLRPATLHYLIGLLASTGLRISEALHLSCADVDLDKGILCIRQTKFRKSRYVPLHLTTQTALIEYAHFRDQCLIAKDPAFFLFDNGRAVNGAQARYAFGLILSRLGMKRPAQGRSPRLYDLRHTFACQRLQSWYQHGQNVHHMMPYLSTYLGHAKVTDTYWYLSGTPKLLGIVAERFESFTQQNMGVPL